MADIRTINKDYEKIAKDLINTEDALEYIRDSNVRIVYLSSEQKKTNERKLVLGQCEKVADKYKWGIPCDFTITVFEPNIETLSDEQIRILLFHELLHVGIVDNGNGEETYQINPHDLEDFKLIIDRFGTEWNIPSEETEFEI